MSIACVIFKVYVLLQKALLSILEFRTKLSGEEQNFQKIVTGTKIFAENFVPPDQNFKEQIPVTNQQCVGITSVSLFVKALLMTKS